MKLWLIIGGIKLLILTYQDFKNKMLVDDRANYLMGGVTIALISYYKPALWYLLFLAFFTIAICFLFKKFKVFGDADINTIAWTFTGFGVMGIPVLIGYIICLGFCFIVSSITNKFLVKRERYPAYIMFLISFLLTAYLFNLWNYDILQLCVHNCRSCGEFMVNYFASLK